MNRLIIIMLIACLSITACGRQKLTQIPQPQQEKQAETPQATVPVSSSKWTAMKWTFGVLAVASLSVALGWNWKEKEYYRAQANMYSKLIQAITMRDRNPNNQIDPRDINDAYMSAYVAVNDYLWQCDDSECEDTIELRGIVYNFMMKDRGLPDDVKQSNINLITHEPIIIMRYPTRSERLVKFKYDISRWMQVRMKKLIS